MKKVLIIINISKDASMKLAQEISAFLRERDFEVDFLSFDGFCDNAAMDGYDFVITLGGDGTVLFAARNCVEHDIPVFPVNLGQFGFLASIGLDEWKDELCRFLEECAVFQRRSMLRITACRDDKRLCSVLALNDAVVNARVTGKTVLLDVSYDGLHLCNLNSDGVIVSTSTGSTAYSASAGGPIIDPALDALVMTPVNSFSLSSRPIVLSSNGELVIRVLPSRTRELSLIVDGQEPFMLKSGDFVKIKRLAKKIRLIGSTPERYYNSLRSKLNWTGGPYA